MRVFWADRAFFLPTLPRATPAPSSRSATLTASSTASSSLPSQAGELGTFDPYSDYGSSHSPSQPARSSSVRRHWVLARSETPMLVLTSSSLSSLPCSFYPALLQLDHLGMLGSFDPYFDRASSSSTKSASSASAREDLTFQVRHPLVDEGGSSDH